MDDKGSNMVMEVRCRKIRGQIFAALKEKQASCSNFCPCLVRVNDSSMPEDRCGVMQHVCWHLQRQVVFSSKGCLVHVAHAQREGF